MGTFDLGGYKNPPPNCPIKPSLHYVPYSRGGRQAGRQAGSSKCTTTTATTTTTLFMAARAYQTFIIYNKAALEKKK